MFAVVLTALAGMLALAFDLGYGFSQRRNTQNAADAGAMAGALAILENAKAQPNVAAAIAGNTFGATGEGPTLSSCDYVPFTMKDDHAGSPWSSLGGCNQYPPAGATGVHVHVAESHPTFFMRALGIDSTTTKGVATAHVQRLAALPKDGPFIVCGKNTVRYDTSGNHSIMDQSGGSWSFRPDADGIDFEIHGPQIENCGAASSLFNGLADNNHNQTLPDPGPSGTWWGYADGNDAGVISQDVNGVNGCKANLPLPPAGCVMVLPIAWPVASEEEEDHDDELFVVARGAFHVACRVSSPSGNCSLHSGRFIYSYSVLGPGDDDLPWHRDYGGPVVIRLTQ
jgi:hypothetical protein